MAAAAAHTRRMRERGLRPWGRGRAVRQLPPPPVSPLQPPPLSPPSELLQPPELLSPELSEPPEPSADEPDEPPPHESSPARTAPQPLLATSAAADPFEPEGSP